MAAPVLLFPEPIPPAVRLAELRRQGNENRAIPTAHNKRPVGTRMRDLGHRRTRRRWRARMIAAVTEWR